MSITTLEAVKAYAGVTSTTTDSVLQNLVNSVSAVLAAYCNRHTFYASTYTALRDGTGNASLLLANFPLRSVMSVVIDERSVQMSDHGGPGYDYVRGGRTVFLRGYAFTRGLRNVKIEYLAGYDADDGGTFPVPSELKLAANMYITTRYRERDKLGISSKSLAGESVSFSDNRIGGAGTLTGGMPAAAATILRDYVNNIPEYDLWLQQ